MIKLLYQRDCTNYCGQVILLLMIFILSAQAYGRDSFRCGTDLVQVNDSRHEILEKCGEPAEEDYDKLIYLDGDRKVILYLFNDELERIESLD